ncbi:MAG TPA: alpha/beta hydrolase [Candidatus Limnocylindrales bacterium]|nr:alpha/beta hydrolase [Candidatus Limnocylindrales bacterium]
MTSRAIGTESVDQPTERYRRAEQAVWSHYGLAPTERFIEVAAGEVRLRVQEVGAGQPIVFVHGGLWPAAGLAGLVRELPGYRSILIDRPGAGLSSPIDWRKREVGSVATQVMGDVLDALGIERTHVIGHSIGGAWALRLALGHPARVERIAILGAAPILAEMPRPTFLRVLASPLGAVMARLPQSQARAKDMLRQDGHGPTLDAGRVPDVLFDWHVALVRGTRTMLNERAMIRDAVIHGNAWRPGLMFEPAQLAGVGQPLLYVIGSADPEGSVDDAKRIVGQLPHAQLHVIPDAGHMLWLDDARGVGNAVRSFLESSAGGSQPGARPGTTPAHDR